MDEQNFSQNPEGQIIQDSAGVSRPSFWHRFKFSRSWIITLVVLLAILVGVWFWLAFIKNHQPGQPEVTVTFDINSSVRSGSISEFVVLFENHDSKDLTKLALEMVYPDGFQFIESNPPSRNGLGRDFDLGDLSAAGSGNVKITGIFTGSPQEVKILKAKVFYQLKNYNAVFSAVGTGQMSLQPPDINLTVTAPSQIIQAQKLDYLISFQNISEQDMDRVRLKVEYPSGFDFAASSLPSTDHAVWEIGRLLIGQGGELKISGRLSGSPGEERVFIASLGFIDDGGNFVLQNRAYKSTLILESPLKISQELVRTAAILNEGDNLDYSVKFENHSDQGMDNVRIVMRFDGEAMDFATIRADGGALVGRELVWNAAAQPGLELLQPGAKGEFKVQANVRKDLNARRIKNPTIEGKIFISSDQLPQPVSGGEINIKIRTQLAVDSEMEYVSGANPPKVGQETVYKVTLTARNSVNDAKDVRLAAVIKSPTAVLLEESVGPAAEKESFSYNLSSGRVTWNIGEMSAFSVSNVEFLVTLNPSVADQGKVLTLVKITEMKGLDNFIEQDVSAIPPRDLLITRIE